MTAHWVAQDGPSGGLVLKTALIAFHHLTSCHTGQELAKVMLHLIDRAEIPVSKVSQSILSSFKTLIIVQLGYFTLDNASNNDTAMEALRKVLYEDREFTFNSNKCWIRCIPHIVNICIQHTIEKFVHANFSNVSDMWGHALDVVHKTKYVEVVTHDSVERSRDIVWSMRSSGQRRGNFCKTIENGNRDGSFTDSTKTIQLPTVQLLCDVKTRWDLTYFMIKRVRILCQVRHNVSGKSTIDADHIHRQ